MLTSSLTGVTSLIFCAKENPLGQFFVIIFSALYGVISFTFDYYGEMIAHLVMTAPMAFFAVAYAANDVILIILRTLAALSDITHLSVVICFIMFLANNIYGFINWSKMQKHREENKGLPPA